LGVELAPSRPNVELRLASSGEPVVVFGFPYDAALVDAMRAIPGRRFDWEAREWLVPRHEVTAVYVADVLDRWPSLSVSDAVTAWLAGMPRGWLARVTTRRHDGHGQFVSRTLAGPLPEELAAHATEIEPRVHTLPFTEPVADALLELAGAKLDAAAAGCATRLRVGIDPPPAVLVIEHTVEEPMFALDTLWDPDAKAAFGQVPGADARASRVPVDPWSLEAIEHFLRTHGVEVAPSARPTLKALREEHDRAADALRRSRSRSADPPDPAPRLGGELAPFQWAGVRYALDTRRTFIADEQGLGKTVQALATLEADGAFPAVVVCPASLKLTWEREAEKWLPHRTRSVVSGRSAVPPRADLTIVNYEIVADHRSALLRARPRALVLDESHYCKNPRAKRTKAVRQLADALPDDGLKLALSGTPVTNGPAEIVPQLRILGRLEEFGSGARLERRFKGNGGEERLHWHLRRSCFVRRLKKDVLPQLPAKRRVVVPVALTNETEYRLAEDDVIAWLRTQPMDLGELDAKIARTLRAERLAQLNALKQLAAHGKLAAATAWIHDFLESGEPLIVFAHHTAVQRAVLERFPDAGHLMAGDSGAQRAETVERFQAGEGPGLLVCSTLVAGHGITLTRASNVAFLELGWTPAQHDQAEDRCHRIGQHDAVTAWYLLAANTIDETIAELLEGKRSVVEAVTDGRRASGESLVEQAAQALRGGAPRRHLRPVA
jgi:hypothetical protein